MGAQGEPNGGTLYLRELVLAEYLTFRYRLQLARYLFNKHFSEDMAPLQGPGVAPLRWTLDHWARCP